jgi:hypothetical protein
MLVKSECSLVCVCVCVCVREREREGERHMLAVWCTTGVGDDRLGLQLRGYHPVTPRPLTH